MLKTALHNQGTSTYQPHPSAVADACGFFVSAERCIVKIQFFLGILILFGIPELVFAVGPSFDCKKAKTKIEKAICSDQELSLLDFKLGHVHREGKLYSKYFDEMENYNQKAKIWLRNRNRECKDENIKKCLNNKYRKRIENINNYLKNKHKEIEQIKESRIEIYGNSYNLSEDLKYKNTISIIKNNSKIIDSKEIAPNWKDLYRKFQGGINLQVIEPVNRFNNFEEITWPSFKEECPNLDYFIFRAFSGRREKFFSEEERSEEEWGREGTFLKASEGLKVFDLGGSSEERILGLLADKYSGRIEGRPYDDGPQVGFFRVGSECLEIEKIRLKKTTKGKRLAIYGFVKIDHKNYFYYLHDDVFLELQIYAIDDLKINKIISNKYAIKGGG